MMEGHVRLLKLGYQRYAPWRRWPRGGLSHAVALGGAVRPRPARLLPLPGPQAGAPVARAGRRGLGQARRRLFRPRLRRQQGAQAGVARRRRARAGLRHPGQHRQRPEQPHPPGRRRRRRARPPLPPCAGGVDQVGRPRLRPGGQHPAVAHHGRRDRAGRRRLLHRGQGDLGACPGAGQARGRQAVCHPGRCLRPPARRPRLRQLRRRAGPAGDGAGACSSTRS